jgi:hypothetical protein
MAEQGYTQSKNRTATGLGLEGQTTAVGFNLENAVDRFEPAGNPDVSSSL